MQLRILKSAFGNLDRSRAFYAQHGQELGDYFLDSLFADIDSLALYAGIHVEVWGFHRMLARRFPYAIFYKVDANICTVYASDRHALKRARFADGTRIVMNRGARIIVMYSEHLRSVLLVRGEATFTVAQEALRPFDLTVGNRRFGTLAAAFDVRLTGSHAMENTVLEGRVTVLTSHGSATLNPVPTVLKASQRIDIEPGKESARTLSEVEAQARIAWQRG